MEDKSFTWLLFELSRCRLPVRILEVGICRGTKLLSWFYNDSAFCVVRRQVKQNSKSKLVLSHFLNQRSPVLEEYNPDKVVAYLYHLKGIRMVKAKEAIELAENQLHGLQVRSIHQALITSEDFSMVFRLKAVFENGELVNEFTFGPACKEAKEEVKDSVLYERAINLTGFFSEYFYKHHGKQIKEMSLDLVPDLAGHLYILRLQKLILTEETCLKSEPFARRGNRNITLKLEPKDEDEIEDGINEINLYKNFLETLKKKEQGRIIRKQQPQNSPLFLEMIAKTFDKSRKNLENEETIKSLKQELESKSGTCSPQLASFSSQRSFRMKVKTKKQFSSINELLVYLESSRPKIWLKDKDQHEGNFSPTIRVSSPLREMIFREISHSEVSPNKKLSKQDSELSPKLNRSRFKTDFLKYVESERLKLKNKLTSSEKVRKIGRKLGKF
jgi:hypothetical protein